MFTKRDKFKYIAVGAWPSPQPQMDWIDSIKVLEQWLTAHIGAKDEVWIWAHDLVETNRQAANVAFKYEKHKTFFLLQWTE